MSDPSVVDGYVRTVATFLTTTTSSTVLCSSNDVEKIDLISTIAGTMTPAVKTMTFTTPTIAVTESTNETLCVSKRGKKSTKVDFVRFDSTETIFSPTSNDTEDMIKRAKIKDEIKR